MPSRLSVLSVSVCVGTACADPVTRFYNASPVEAALAVLHQAFQPPLRSLRASSFPLILGFDVYFVGVLRFLMETCVFLLQLTDLQLTARRCCMMKRLHIENT